MRLLDTFVLQNVLEQNKTQQRLNIVRILINPSLLLLSTTRQHDIRTCYTKTVEMKHYRSLGIKLGPSLIG